VKDEGRFWALVEECAAADLDVAGRVDALAAALAARGDVHVRAFVVDPENPPLRIFLGSTPRAIATRDHEWRLAEWRAGERISIEAAGSGPPPQRTPSPPGSTVTLPSSTR
jgi:hypothetical protein